MYQLVLTLLLCWLALPVLAQQQLAKARQSSYLTKVFRLTTAQAQRLYERGLRYILNPARLEIIYFLTKYGRTAGQRMSINEYQVVVNSKQRSCLDNR